MGQDALETVLAITMITKNQVFFTIDAFDRFSFMLASSFLTAIIIMTQLRRSMTCTKVAGVVSVLALLQINTWQLLMI